MTPRPGPPTSGTGSSPGHGSASSPPPRSSPSVFGRDQLPDLAAPAVRGGRAVADHRRTAGGHRRGRRRVLDHPGRRADPVGVAAPGVRVPTRRVGVHLDRPRPDHPGVGARHRAARRGRSRRPGGLARRDPHHRATPPPPIPAEVGRAGGRGATGRSTPTGCRCAPSTTPTRCGRCLPPGPRSATANTPACRSSPARPPARRVRAGPPGGGRHRRSPPRAARLGGPRCPGVRRGWPSSRCCGSWRCSCPARPDRAARRAPQRPGGRAGPGGHRRRPHASWTRRCGCRTSRSRVRFAVAADRRTTPTRSRPTTSANASRGLGAHHRLGRRRVHRPEPAAPDDDAPPGGHARRTPAAARVPGHRPGTRGPRRAAARPRRARPGPGPGQGRAGARAGALRRPGREGAGPLTDRPPQRRPDMSPTPASTCTWSVRPASASPRCC